jgi:hypothetical protein
MTEDKKPIDQHAIDSLSVAPGGNGDKPIHDPRQEAGQDESIEERLQRDPTNKEARLDRAGDESMDASDPPASTQPIHNHEPPASSGYDPEAERKRQEEKQH